MEITHAVITIIQATIYFNTRDRIDLEL